MFIGAGAFLTGTALGAIVLPASSRNDVLQYLPSIAGSASYLPLMSETIRVVTFDHVGRRSGWSAPVVVHFRFCIRRISWSELPAMRPIKNAATPGQEQQEIAIAGLRLARPHEEGQCSRPGKKHRAQRAPDELRLDGFEPKPVDHDRLEGNRFHRSR